ncbi:MAG: transcriptional repressor [Alphaproteobacteria bacterium]|nr:transcriptional repressor [Alphaproteobacteria bacterium]
MQHDHHQCVDDALKQAETLCKDNGARLTPIRKRVLELVWSSHKPVGAYDILEILNSERRGSAPPTVYRALDFLLEHGLVHRIEFLNAFIGCNDPGAPHVGQFVICRECRDAIELNDPKIPEVIANVAYASGYTDLRHTVEVEGICPNCQKS